MSSACFIVQPFYKRSAQKGQSKHHCMCIKEKQNNSSQSFLRNPLTLKLPLAHVWKKPCVTLPGLLNRRWGRQRGRKWATCIKRRPEWKRRGRQKRRLRITASLTEMHKLLSDLPDPGCSTSKSWPFQFPSKTLNSFSYPTTVLWTQMFTRDGFIPLVLIILN